MAVHKTIDRRKAATDAQSVVRRLTPVGTNAGTSAPTTGQKHKTVDRHKAATDAQSVARRLTPAETTEGASGYYSPREYGSQTESYAARVNTARAAMEERGRNLTASQTEVEQLWTAAQRAAQAYQSTKGKFRGADAGKCEKQMMDSWTQATRNYADRYQAFQKEFDEYKPYEDAYNAAVGEYNAYQAAEQADYDKWKASIRDAETIRAEQKGLKEKRAELTRRMQQANDITAGTAASGIHAQAAQNETRIRELQEYLGGVGDREKLLKEELDWAEHFRYEDLRKNADFAMMSRYDKTVQDEDYHWINDTDVTSLRNATRSERDPFAVKQYMEKDEVTMYNYLYSARGEDEAKKYLEYLKPKLNSRRAGETGERISTWAGEHPVAASAVSIAMSPVSGVVSGLGQLGDMVMGKEVDPNSNYNMMSNQKNAIREAVSGKVEENWGPAGSFLYNTGMSMADMAADAALGGPAAMALIGSRSFSESVIDGKNRGLSNAEAFALGATSAAAEVLTEKIGLDEHLKLPKAMKDKGFWKGLLKGAIGEGTEEGITNIANLAADISIAGDKSEFAKNIERHKNEGKDDQAALLGALGDAGISLALDTLGGAISGGIFGGFDGWRGKSAANMQQDKEEAAPAAAPKKTSGNASVGIETSDRLGFVVDGDGAADNGIDVSDHENTGNGNRSAAARSNTGLLEGDSQDGAQTAHRNRAAGLEELKRQAVNRRNPLISGVMQTAEQEELVRRIQKATTKTEVTALDRGLSDEDTKMLLRLRELTGREIVVDAYSTDYHGYFDRAAGEIHLSADGSDLMTQAFGHELTHNVEGTDGWGKLQDLVRERVKSEGKSWDALRKEKIRFYAEKGQHLTAADADAEIVARYVEQHLLTDETSIRKMVRDDRSVARRILDWLDGIWAKVAKTEGAKEREFIRKAREVYRNALAEDSARSRRQELRQSMVDAYADGDDAAGDAVFDEMYRDHGSLLEADWSDFDENEVQFSFAGENAKGADREALERAQRMEEQGFDKRQIFRDTGWFQGADGKWRFEIDDSGMKWHKMGDAQFRADHPEYVRFRDLERKFIEGTITDGEIAEMAELKSTWSDEAPRLRQMVVRGNAKLRHVLEHDALFEQYPQLQDVKVRFGDTDDAGGWWDKDRNEIVLSDRYRHADPGFLEQTLLHEIQHAIQDMEGFANGANPEYWEEVQRGDKPVREHDAEIAKAEREARAALKGVLPEVQKDFWYAANMNHTDPEGAQKLENELFEGEYADAYSDYSWAIWTLQDLLEQENPKRAAKDLYRSTAGEIEARDAANRRHLDAETRKNRLPNTGDERTVFVEGSGRQYSSEENDYWYTKSFAEQLVAFQNGDLRGDDTLVIGTTPQVLKQIGLAALPMTINQKHIGDALNGTYKGTQAEIMDHTFSLQELSTLPEKLANPIAIIQDKRNGKQRVSESNIDVFVEMKVASGKQVLAAVQVNGNGHINGIRIDSNKVATVHGNKDCVQRLIDAIADEQAGDTAVYYLNEEKTTKMLQSTGNPIPSGLSNLDGFNHSISEPASPVKMRLTDATQSQQFKRWFGDWQNHPEKASKVVNADGTPKVVYHGTNAKFHTFDTETGAYWFSENEDYAEAMMEERGGGYVIAAYLSMKNPYRAVLPPGKFSDPGYEAPILREARANGHDGVIIECDTTDPLVAETFYVVFDSKQVKSATDNRGTFDAKNPDIRYSFNGEENGFTEGWHDDDEAARAAQMEGYPVLNGVQVVPMKTWVRARDYKRNPDGSIFYDRQGNPVQYDNYGLVVGLGDKPGTLKINFHNKNVVNEETGQTIRRDNVQIAYEDLTPTPGVFSQTDEDFDSLIGQAPEEPGSYDYSEEELAEIEALRNRAGTEEDADEERPVWTAVEPEKLSGKERDFYSRARRKLAEQVARALDVPRQAKREFLDPIAERIADEYLQTGTVSQELRSKLFEEGWKQGIVVDREFLDTYKEVKDYLRTTGITLSETDRDNRDWAEFRKRSFGTLKLVNEGGLPVDTAWGELQEMAPALFPNDILNPEDMVKHMAEVAASIRKTEKSLDEFYGPNADLMKRASRNDFEVAVQNAMAELRQVKLVADERMQEAAAVTGEEGEELTAEAVVALYPKLKETRRAAEKAMAKNLLTKQDKQQVQRLLRGDIQPEHLDPKKDSVAGILAVYEAKKAFEEAAVPIRKWNRQQKAKLYAQAEEIVSTAGRIEDKKRGFLYSRETLERNIRDIVKDPEAADRMVEVYAKPVHKGSADAIRMKNRYRERVKALNLSRKVTKGNTVSEAYAVQFYGEVSDILRMMEESKFRLKKRDGKTYLEWKAELQKLWEENPNLDKGKIEAAAQEFGRIYEELFTQMNEVRVRNGYEPINHRSGYFPHFQQDGRDGILSQFGKALGIDVEVQQLPTTINGLTHTFKPGIRWFGNALERKGFDTAYDAVEGFDRYIEGVADVVHHTDNIQRLRALANQIRYRTSDEGLREQIRKIQERTDLSDEEKDALIREKTSEGKFELSNFVVELDEYTNLLANKKSRADRNMEQAMGRDMYNVIKALESRVAANMVAINPGSWLTNFIPITQGWACLDTRMMLKGMRDTVVAVKNDDGIVDESDFLTGRQGSDPLVRTAAEEWSGKLSKPMEWIDGFTAGTLVRARLQQNLAQGMSRAEAMSEANEWTAGVMADRTKGAMPTVFHRSNPLTKLFTQFQLEVNNQLSYLWKDIPREKRDKSKKELALALLKFALGAWLYNQAYEFFFGRRPALDVADMAFGFADDWTDPELDFADAAMGLGEKIAENTPFVGGLLGGGRVPISSALPDAENLIKAVGNKEWSAKKRLATAAKELTKPAVYMLPPFGGGQIKKVWEGLKMIRQGGSYTVDAKGNPLLQYPLYSTDSDIQKALEAGQAMIFGKTTIRSGREWVEGGFGNLSADQTATYQALIAMDVEQADAFDLLKALRSAEKEGDKSKTAVQRDILRASGLEGDALATVYYDLMVDDDSKENALMESLQEGGADMGKVTNCLMDMKDADLLEGAVGSNAMRDALRTSGLTDGQKQEIYRIRISDSRDDDIKAFQGAGLDMDDFLEVQNHYTSIKENYEDESDMATAFARWVNAQSYTKAQKDTARDCFKYWNMIPANADQYDKALEAGLDDEAAFELTEELDDLEPPEGKDSVQQIQKWRVGIDSACGPENQLQRLKAVGMDEKVYAKCEALWNTGVAPAAYVCAQELKGQFDSDGNGSLTNKDWEKLIDSITTYDTVLPGDSRQFHLTNEQKGFLWQMLTGSKSTKNNPFSRVGGEKWLRVKG